MEKLNMSRRSFVKTAAVAGAVCAVAGQSSTNFVEAAHADTSSSGEEKVVHTACRACISNCAVKVTVRDGRVVRIVGDEIDPMSKGRICAKGAAGIQALYNPNRLKYPMKRVGERGTNNWERITWEEALDTIADKLMDLYEQDPMTLIVSGGGGGNPQFYSQMRFLQAFDGGNFFEPGCAQCYLPRNHAQPVMNGQTDNSIADSNAYEIYYSGNQYGDNMCKCLVLWGTDPSQSCPASGGRALCNLRENGTKTVVIDPRFTPDAAKADIWLPIRPGTDVALELAWIKYILDNKLYDEEFCMKWTNLPFLINPETKYTYKASELGFEVDEAEDKYTFVVWDKTQNAPRPAPFPWDETLDAQMDGEFEYNGVTGIKTGFRALKECCEEWTLAKAAEVCWLDEDKIEEAIKLYVENSPNAGISLGVATDQYEQSAQAAMGTTIIDIIMSNVDNPGNLTQQRPAQNPGTYLVPAYDKYGYNEMGPTYETELRRLGFIEHKGLGFWKASHIGTIRTALETGEPYLPRVWIDRSGNKPAMLGGARHFLEAAKKFELIVHMYMYPTAMSVEMADIILPAAEWLETSYACDRCNVFLIRQRVVQLFECVDETLMWSWLTKKLADKGHPKCQRSFTGDFSNVEKLSKNWLTYEEYEEFLASVISRSFTKKYPEGLTWEQCKELMPMEITEEEAWVQNSYGYYKQISPTTGKPYGFSRTTSLRCEPYAEGMIRLGRTGNSAGKDSMGFSFPAASVDYPPLPYYREPHESPVVGDDGYDAQYPYTLTEGRVPMYHHGTLRNVPYLREIYPVPLTWINPKTAAEVGVETGDWIKLTSRRDSTHGKVLVTEGIAPGVLYQERFWNPELLDSDDPSQAWKAMNINLLTKHDEPYNDEYGTYTLRGFQVNIEKSTKPEGVWEDPEEFEPWMPVPSDNTGGGDAVYDA